ncbi:hypothetical protein ACIQVU_18595 [Lysinibacillus sp. NPDC098008]|uniref:hypothetical protein n=1 Tax=Lysinibacillus sp. NPDC098008 TaxID=3364146 RepID=UPI003820F260
MKLLTQAMEIHRESINYFNDFYTGEWEGNENKLILAIITSLKSSELYIRYLLCSKSNLLLFKNMSDELVSKMISGEYQGTGILKHKITFEEAVTLFDKFYDCEFGKGGIKCYYVRLSNWLDKLHYNDFNNEINYLKLIRDILSVYFFMELFISYMYDLELIEENKDLNEILARYEELNTDFHEKNLGVILGMGF